MNNRFSIFSAGFLILFGVYQLRLGIKTKKASDIALGIICILGGGVLVVMMVVSGRNR